MPFDSSLNTHWLRLNLSGGDFLSVLPDLSLSLRFQPDSGSLISWDGLSLPSALQSFGLVVATSPLEVSSLELN